MEGTTEQRDSGHSGGAALTLAIAGLLSLAAAMGIGRFVYTPILPFMIADLGLSPSAAGLIASANFLGYLLGALAAAARRLPGGARSWFLGALAASAATTAAMGIAEGVTAFMILRFLGGIASAGVLVFASTLVLERLMAAGRGNLSALHFAGVGSGIAISAVLIAGLAGLGVAWHGQWLWSGALAGLALLVAWRLVPERPDAPAPTPTSDSATTGSRLKLLILAYGLFGFGYVITATFISAIVRTAPEARFLEPVIWLLVGLAAAPSVALWAWAGRRIGLAQAFALACLVEALGVGLSVMTGVAAAVALGAILVGGTFMGITAVGLVLARQLSAGEARRSLALMTAAFGLGQMIGPSFAGFAYRFGESFVVPSLAAASALIAAAALAWRVGYSAPKLAK